MKKKDKKSNAKDTIIARTVGVEKKKDVVLIRNNVEKLSEEDIKNLIQFIEKENKQMKDMYYAFNTPIANTRQRTFKDLVKKFFRHMGEFFDIRAEEVVSKKECS